MVVLTPDREGIARAAAMMSGGRVVLWPSGGVYGLATSALSPEGVSRIYAIKKRPETKPLQVLTAPGQAAAFGVLSAGLEKVIRQVWPAHVGFVVARRAPELEAVEGPGGTILIVCPNRVARLLAETAPCPLVGTSANLSGRQEIVTPEEAAQQFVETVDAIIDGGVQTGQLNTLLDTSRGQFRVLRKGAVEPEKVLAMLAETAES